MNKRLQNRFHLHRLSDDLQLGSMLSIDDGTDPNAGGGGGGGGKTAEEEAAEAAAAKAAADAAALAAKGKTPTDDEAKLLKDVMKHKTRAESLAADLAAAKARVDAYGGADPAKVAKLLKDAEDAEKAQLEAKGEYSRLVAQMGERHTAELTAVKGEVTQKDQTISTLSSQIADLTVGTAFGSSEYVREGLMMPIAKTRALYASHFEFKDGKIVGYDKPAGASDRTPLVDSTGNTLNFEEAMKKIIAADPDRDAMERSKAKPGAGSGTLPKGGPKPGAGKERELSSIEKISKGLKALAQK